MSNRDLVKSLFVNDVNVTSQSNSFVMNTGGGERSIEGFNGGNGEIVPVTAVNVSTQVGMVKFEMPNTKEARDLIAEWEANDSNLVQVVYKSGDILTWESMVLEASPDIPGGADTNIEVSFKGKPSK